MKIWHKKYTWVSIREKFVSSLVGRLTITVIGTKVS